jgi:hypothetical protein
MSLRQNIEISSYIWSSDADGLYQDKSEDIMNAFFETISWVISVMRTEFDLDPANLWLR